MSQNCGACRYFERVHTTIGICRYFQSTLDARLPFWVFFEKISLVREVRPDNGKECLVWQGGFSNIEANE